MDKEAYNDYLLAYELWKNPSKLDQAEEYLSLAIKKDPKWVSPCAGLAQIWVLRLQYGLVEPGLARQMVHEYINWAIELDPLNPFILGLYSGELRSTRQFQEALKYAEKAQALGHVSTSAQFKLALMALEEYDKAWEHRFIAISSHFSEELVKAIDLIYKEQGYHAADKEIVRQFELLARERYVPCHILAKRHYVAGEYSKALDDLENGYPDLYDSTRFIAIVKKMNLPLPKN